MGYCLRGKLADAGLFPGQPATETATAQPVAAQPAETPAEPETQLLPATELDVAPPAEPADDIVAATFGLLRAEPDGSVVIAGSGTPGSEVEVYSDDTLLGSTTVESSGDWVFVPDTPLPVGGVEITLAERGKAGRATQSFVVVVNEDKTAQPLVVASVPGQASEVIQGLAAPATQIATAEPLAVPSSETTPAAEAAQSGPSTSSVPVATAAVPAETQPAPTPTTASEPAIAPAAPAPVAAPVAPTPPAAAPPAAPAEPPATPATANPTPTPPAPEAPAVAAVEAQPSTPSEPAIELAAVPPTIDAIEVEGGQTFFAGAGPDGGTIRLYVDDQHVADSEIDGGRWLVEGGAVLAEPSQRVRADLLAPGSSEVIARAEVDFVLDLPTTEPPTAVAAADPAPAPEPSAPPATPEVVDATPVQVDPVTPTPASAPQVASTPEPVEPAIPTMVAVVVGDPDAQRFASGKAIIRRGDNLWTIARRVYGEGIKYTTIYEANTGQIRDPDRIYPGQVFGLPN